ncbi:T9SS type A sorting domain-containing protein [bacterium]|nr:T9SS type A sorting domain-containing protein [bacterium]
MDGLNKNMKHVASYMPPVFKLPQSGDVQIQIFNLLGQQVFRTSNRYCAGAHRFVFDASSVSRDLTSGMYLIRLSYQNKIQQRKVFLLK